MRRISMLGASGTGKTTVVSTLADSTPRSDRAWITVSEAWGHYHRIGVKGRYFGAIDSLFPRLPRLGMRYARWRLRRNPRRVRVGTLAESTKWSPLLRSLCADAKVAVPAMWLQRLTWLAQHIELLETLQQMVPPETPVLMDESLEHKLVGLALICDNGPELIKSWCDVIPLPERVLVLKAPSHLVAQRLAQRKNSQSNKLTDRYRGGVNKEGDDVSARAVNFSLLSGSYL